MTRALALGALLGVGACAGDDFDPMGHGSVEIEFRRRSGVRDDPYATSNRLLLGLERGECLRQFYGTHPEWAQEGAEGAPVFAAWKDRLCELSTAPCTVEEFAGRERLWVWYSLHGTVENHTLHYGPLPLPELAECDPGDVPSVSMWLSFVFLDGDDVTGVDVVSAKPSKVVGGQAEPMVIEARYIGD